MTKDQVAGLIEQIPQFLTPDEFLVALATKAAEWEYARVCKEFDLNRKDAHEETTSHEAYSGKVLGEG